MNISLFHNGYFLASYEKNGYIGEFDDVPMEWCVHSHDDPELIVIDDTTQLSHVTKPMITIPYNNEPYMYLFSISRMYNKIINDDTSTKPMYYIEVEKIMKDFINNSQTVDETEYFCSCFQFNEKTYSDENNIVTEKYIILTDSLLPFYDHKFEKVICKTSGKMLENSTMKGSISFSKIN